MGLLFPMIFSPLFGVIDSVIRKIKSYPKRGNEIRPFPDQQSRKWAIHYRAWFMKSDRYLTVLIELLSGWINKGNKNQKRKKEKEKKRVERD